MNRTAFVTSTLQQYSFKYILLIHFIKHKNEPQEFLHTVSDTYLKRHSNIYFFRLAFEHLTRLKYYLLYFVFNQNVGN